MRSSRSAFASALLAVATFACTGPNGWADAPQDRYQLVRIGAAPVPRPAQEGICDPAPVAAWYRLRGDRWASTDTLAGCNAPGHGRIAVVATEGRVERRGDTLRFYVADTAISVHGLVDIGWSRGDTLVVSGSEEEGGDYTFVRRR